GLEAEYEVPPAWELSQQNEMIESLVAQGYNAFLVFPGDASGTNATLGELKDFEIPSAALAGCTVAPTPALFCLGTDVYNSAYLGTKELIEALGGSGKIAHFTGFLVDPNTQLRIEAVEKAAGEHDGVEVIQVIADIDAPEPADEKINAFLAAQGENVDGIVTTAWVPAVVAATSLRNLGDKRIKMVGIDHDEVVLDAIKDGFVHGTMLQNPYGQGYIGVYAMDLVRGGCGVKDDAPWKTTAQTNKFIDSGTAFVGADQVANYQDAMVRVTDDIMKDFKATYMDCPN
ncbi:MAG: substrate-binding domain-containing protein, partial [Pseudomonadota bacterium]